MRDEQLHKLFDSAGEFFKMGYKFVRYEKLEAEIKLLKCQNKALAEKCQILGPGISEDGVKQLVIELGIAAACMTRLKGEVDALVREVSND